MRSLANPWLKKKKKTYWQTGKVLRTPHSTHFIVRRAMVLLTRSRTKSLLGLNPVRGAARSCLVTSSISMNRSMKRNHNSGQKIWTKEGVAKRSHWRLKMTHRVNQRCTMIWLLVNWLDVVPSSRKIALVRFNRNRLTGYHRSDRASNVPALGPRSMRWRVRRSISLQG